MDFKISTSLRSVSSKPGVSMRQIRRPSKSNLGASCTLRVQESNDSEVRRVESLAILMNCPENESKALLNS